MSTELAMKAMQAARGHIIAWKGNKGEVCRGKLTQVSDNMDLKMAEITITFRDGHTRNLEKVYVRSSNIKYINLPDVLKEAGIHF